MAKQTIDIDIKINSKTGEISLKSLDKNFENVKIKAGQAQQAAKALNIEVSKISAGGNVRVAGDDFEKLGKQIGGASAASGSASSSVLEMGRVISDSNYGIRGVANNLSQLASNLLFTAKSAGGFGAALGQIGKTLMGPLGVLLLIQTGIALLERWSMTAEKASKSNESIAESASKAASNLQILRRANEIGSMSMDEAGRAVKRANEEYKDLNLAIDENGRLTDESVKAIDSKINALKRLAKAQAIQTLVEEQYAKIATLSLEISDANQLSVKKYAEAQRIRARADEDAASGAVSRNNRVEQAAVTAEASFNRSIENISELTKKRGDVENEINKLIELIPDVKDLFNDPKKSGYGGGLGRIFKQQALDLEKFIISNNRRSELALERNEKQKALIQEKYDKEDLERRRDSFIEKQRQRLADFMKSKATDEDKAAAQATFRASETQAEEEYQEGLTSLITFHTAKRQAYQLELMRKFTRDMMNNRLEDAKNQEGLVLGMTDGTEAGALNKPQYSVGAEDLERQQEASMKRRELEKENFESDLKLKRENLENQGYSLLEIEQLVASDRNAWMIGQMEFEVQLERDKIDAKRNINQEYISWVAGLGGIMKNIAGENEALATAALVLEKGAAIANVVVETQAANQSILANTSAEAGKVIASGTAAKVKGAIMYAGGNPAGAGLIAAGAAGIASAAGIKAGGAARIGKNKIAAGISIASILSTSLTSKGSVGGAAGGGGGEGGGGRSFDFNLVGSTGVNQLAEGIGGQFSQPIQAYVVSSQMTSQQQLDNVIQSSATIGD